MLRVGINKNVFLDKAEINDKGSLVISFRVGEVVKTTAEDDLLNTTAGVKPGSGLTNIIIWPVKTQDNDAPRETKNIANDLRAVRDQLEHLLQGYVTSDRAALNPYAGIDTTDSAAFITSLSKQSVVDVIYKNLVNQFIAKLNEIKDQLPVKSFRLLLIRRSSTNHYGTLRKNFITDNPFWESETIPETSSRVKFTAYEYKNGLNNGEPVAKESVADAVPNGAVSAADSILGAR